jgi:hypothetical protein
MLAYLRAVRSWHAGRASYAFCLKMETARIDILGKGTENSAFGANCGWLSFSRMRRAVSNE